MFAVLNDMYALDLSLLQGLILARLNETESARGTDLARDLGVTDPAISRSVGRLVELKFVDTTRDAIDRRAVHYTLTNRARTRFFR
jgi:DNA-binding MarR family transcriptional regulator